MGKHLTSNQAIVLLEIFRGTNTGGMGTVTGDLRALVSLGYIRGGTHGLTPAGEKRIREMLG